MTDSGGDTEDILVYMDFDTKIEDSFFSSNKEFKLVGLDTQGPILQLGNQVFQGEWKDSIGSHLFMEEVAGNQFKTDPLFSENLDKTLNYCFKTDKLLHMSRVFLKPKAGNDSDSNDNDASLQKNDAASLETNVVR